MRRLPMAAGHNALREIGSRSLARSQELPWHEWGVPISGSTGWAHYPAIALSNLVSALGCASLKLPAEQAPGSVCR